jgi:HEAT repeat protein
MLWWTRRQLKSNDKKTRRQALVKLGESGNEQAIEYLIGALDDDDWEVQCEAITTLGKIGSERAISSLVTSLKHDSGSVRYEAAKVLRQLGWKPENDEQAVLFALIDGGASFDQMLRMGSRAVSSLAAALKINDSHFRSKVLDVLGHILGSLKKPYSIPGNSGSSTKQQRKLLINKSEIEAYEKLVDVVISPLSDALADDNPRVRRRAVEVLSVLDDARIAVLLTAALNDDDETVRTTAGRVIEKSVSSEVDRLVTDSKAIAAIVEASSRNDLLDDTLLNAAVEELQQEGANATRSLAALIEEMLACRTARIKVALWAASRAVVTPELIGALREVISAPALAEQPTLLRFDPEIIGDNRVGWTDGTAQDVRRLAEDALNRS